jgi:GAF domain-containing protein
MEDGNMIQSIDNNQRLIAIPLKIRGQVIGAMEFELGNDGRIDPNDLNLIQEVGERFGLAAENTRLVEESQHIAQREALINEIGSRLQATNNIESTLTEAVRSLSNVLGANRVSIKLREPNT